MRLLQCVSLYTVAAAERSWYSDDEDEKQVQNAADDITNAAQNLPTSTVSHVMTVQPLVFPSAAQTTWLYQLWLVLLPLTSSSCNSVVVLEKTPCP